MTCKEFPLADVSSITAIPLSAYTATGTMLTPVIANNNFNPTFNANTIVIGTRKATASGNPVGSLVPIIHGTGKVKDDESDSVAGRKHTVAVSSEIDDRDRGVWATLLTLERAPHHLILTGRTGVRFFVRSTEDTYRFEVTRDGSKTSVQFRIECLMGLQLIA